MALSASNIIYAFLSHTIDPPLLSATLSSNLTSIIASRLQDLTNEIISINEILRYGKLQLNQDEYKALESASIELAKRAENVPKEIRDLGKRRANAIEGQKLLSSLETTNKELLAGHKLAHRPTFIRNVQLIFDSPKKSRLDSVPVKARKRITRERCERLRDLGLDGIIL